MRAEKAIRTEPNEWLARKLLRKARSFIHQAKDLVRKAEHHMPDEAEAFTELQMALQAASDATKFLIRVATARIDARLKEDREGREIIVYPRRFIKPKAIVYDAETGEVIYKAEPDTVVCDVCNNDLTSEHYVPTLVIHDADGHYIWGVICPDCALKYHANTRLTLVPDFSKAGKELRAELIKGGWRLCQFGDIIAVRARTSRIHELYEVIHDLLGRGQL